MRSKAIVFQTIGRALSPSPACIAVPTTKRTIIVVQCVLVAEITDCRFQRSVRLTLLEALLQGDPRLAFLVQLPLQRIIEVGLGLRGLALLLLIQLVLLAPGFSA